MVQDSEYMGVSKEDTEDQAGGAGESFEQVQGNRAAEIEDYGYGVFEE